MSHSVAEILLVEDNPGDVDLTREALRESKLANRLHVARDGIEALAFLRRGDPRPDLVLLDLNLPRMDGRELLRQIKQDPDLRRIPVVIMTSSAAEEDICRSYDLLANGYVVKPIDFDRFVQIVRGIEEFWLAIVTLPPK